MVWYRITNIREYIVFFNIDTRQFKRNEYLKEILYGIHQNGDSVGLEKYLKRLKLSEYGGL